MKTKLQSIHEEEITSDNPRIIGILMNYSIEGEFWKDSFPYLYIKKDNMYIFFNTLIDLFDYYLYGKLTESKRAYMTEEQFDHYFDSVINGKFGDILKWC